MHVGFPKGNAERRPLCALQVEKTQHVRTKYHKQQFILFWVLLYDVETFTRTAAYRTRNVVHPQPVEFGANLRGSGTKFELAMKLRFFYLMY